MEKKFATYTTKIDFMGGGWVFDEPIKSIGGAPNPCWSERWQQVTHRRNVATGDVFKRALKLGAKQLRNKKRSINPPT